MIVLVGRIIMLLGIFLCYQLALAFIGTAKRIKEVILPVLIFAIIVHVSKFIFQTTPTVHTGLLVLVSTLLLWLLNDIKFLMAIAGSLLTYIAITLGELLINNPLLLKLGFHLPRIPGSLEYFLLDLVDIILIVLIIGLVKLSKFSISKYIAVIMGK